MCANSPASRCAPRIPDRPTPGRCRCRYRGVRNSISAQRGAAPAAVRPAPSCWRRCPARPAALAGPGAALPAVLPTRRRVARTAPPRGNGLPSRPHPTPTAATSYATCKDPTASTRASSTRSARWRRPGEQPQPVQHRAVSADRVSQDLRAAHVNRHTATYDAILPSPVHRGADRAPGHHPNGSFPVRAAPIATWRA